MAKVNVDIDKLSAWVSDFDKCTRIYNTAIESFFDKIKQYKGWEGSAAVTYLNKVNSESLKYIYFGNDLSNFCIVLSGIVDNLESTLVSTAKE